MGTKSGSENLNWNFPDAVTAGQPTPPFTFTSSEEVPSFDVEIAHTYQGYSSISLNGEASVTVSAPQEDISRTVSYSMPTTTVPASGSLTLTISGTFPSLTFPGPGVAQVTVGTITVYQTARDANGNPMSFGTFTETCTPTSGKSVLLQSVQINPAPATTRPSASASASASKSAPRQTQSHQYEFGSSSDSSSHTRSGRATSQPSPTSTTHPPVAISGKEIGIIAAAAVGIMGIAGLAAWIAAWIRQIRKRR
jgi:hypothetical protein